jgi:hypothetical protein
MAFMTATKTVRRAGAALAENVSGDICVVGAGISGVSAALEAARLGRRVVLVDSLPALGGQAVNSIIGTFCGLFSNGVKGYQFTHGIADEILQDLGAKDALFYRVSSHTTVVMYDEVALSRWVEEAIRKAGITVILGAVLRGVTFDGRRVRTLDIATRYGDVRVSATGFVDASGDAVIAWLAGLPCREAADGPVYGSQMMVLEGIDEKHQPSREEITARLKAKAASYNMVRHDGFSFVFPGRNVALVNMTHMETPLEPVAASRTGLEGKAQTDTALAFLKTEFPKAYGKARVRAYGFPGIRQTRWIAASHQLKVEEVQNGTAFDDAIARTAWPIEIHDRPDGYTWQQFPENHVHYVPLRSMISPDADNLVAAGRCIDGDVAALSSVRVMGPCIAMGAAASHALDLAGSGSVHQLDIGALKKRLKDNLERTDRPAYAPSGATV